MWTCSRWHQWERSAITTNKHLIWKPKWCICLARHAPFTGSNRGGKRRRRREKKDQPFELLSHPEWVRVCTTPPPPTAILHRPTQTDECTLDRGGSGGTKRGWQSAQSSCQRWAIPDLILSGRWPPNKRCLVRSSSPPEIMSGLLVSVRRNVGPRESLAFDASFWTSRVDV